ADDAYLMDIAREMVDHIVTFTRGGREASFEMESFDTFPSALQRRAFHLILNHLYHELPKNLSYIHEENFFKLVKSDAGNKEIDLPEKLKVVRTYQRVQFYMEDDQPTIDRSYGISMNVPGETRLPDGSLLIASMVQHPSSQGKY